MYLVEAKSLYVRRLRRAFGDPVGASDVEIDALEHCLGTRLPVAYREFLSWMGNDINGVFRGTECFAGDTHANTVWLPEFFDECGIRESYVAGSICFWSHHGYVAAWFDAHDPSEDPSCYDLSDLDCKVRSVGRLSAYIRGCLEDIADGLGLPV